MTSSFNPFDHVPEVFRELEQQSDLGVVIIGVTLIEGLVDSLIGNYSDLDEVEFIMRANLERKAEVARALGRLSFEDVENLRRFMEMRNFAAHPRKTLAVDLTDPDYSNRLDKIIDTLKEATFIDKDDAPRQKLIMLINRMAGHLEGRIHYDERESPVD